MNRNIYCGAMADLGYSTEQTSNMNVSTSSLMSWKDNFWPPVEEHNSISRKASLFFFPVISVSSFSSRSCSIVISLPRTLLNSSDLSRITCIYILFCYRYTIFNKSPFRALKQFIICTTISFIQILAYITDDPNILYVAVNSKLHIVFLWKNGREKMFI